MKIFKIVLAIGLVVLFGGCVSSTSSPKPQSPSKKTFAQEDAYILFALRAEQLKDYASASDMFKTLWQKSKKTEYLYRSYKNELLTHKYKDVLKRVDADLVDMPDDIELLRVKVFALLGTKENKQALILAKELASKTKKIDDYILVADIYIEQKDYEKAVKYLHNAYMQENYNELLLDKMAVVLYIKLDKKKDAIEYLETHSKINGCSKRVCKRLLVFYANMNDMDGLLSTYLRFYEMKKSDELAKRIIQIYDYKKEYLKLMSFLEESSSNDEVLLQIYINFKHYKKASKLAQKLYEESGDLDKLGQSAIFEYEGADDKKDKKLQKRVIKKLKEVVSVEKKPLYLNYLGYLMIDNSIDVKEGIEYVKEALKENEDSAYYLDSLAWGYYKLGKCKKASQIINKANKLEGGDDPEVLEHIKIINRCKKRR
jgi:lipopolysaccharide biosynthesis regulator YciM